MSSTPLDAFRTVLDHLDESDRTQQLLFFRTLHATGTDAVQELAQRVQKTATGRGLRQLAFESSFYYPWPDWVPMLTRMLRHEPDLYLFGIGLHALARIANKTAFATLRELSQIRVAPEFQKMVSEILAQADPEKAFHYHLACLLEGSSNPSVANKAAHHLEELVNADSLEPLKTVIMHPDLLVFRHALRLVAKVPSTEAASFLAGFLADCHADVLEDRRLKELLPSFRGISRSAAVEEALKLLAPRFESRNPEAIQILQNETGSHAQETLERLKEQASNVIEEFLIKVIAAAQENNQAHLQGLPTEIMEAMHLRARRMSFAMDAGAEGLAQMVHQGLYPAKSALSLLEQAVRETTGREGLIHAFTQLVPSEATELLDLAISHPDGSLRAVAVEALGERNEEALRPALLKACKDPITDISQRALAHLGRLPDAEGLARELLHSLSLEEINLGLDFIGMHRLSSLVDELVNLVRDTQREELAIKALQALGTVGSTQAAPMLLELLHSGQGPRLQVALAHAIRDLKDPATAVALCLKADELKSSQIHAIAVEALCWAGQELDAEEGELLLEQIRNAWNDKNPWPLRLRVILALRDARLKAREQWVTLFNLVQGALNEKRAPGAWSQEELAQVQNTVKELGQRAKASGA